MTPFFAKKVAEQNLQKAKEAFVTPAPSTDLKEAVERAMTIFVLLKQEQRTDKYLTELLLTELAPLWEKMEWELVELKRQYEVCHILLPAAEQVVHDAKRLLNNEPHYLSHSVDGHVNAEQEAKKVGAASILPSEKYYREEKADISNRLGHPKLEPWCAADLVVKERDSLKSENEKLKAVCENKTILLRAVRYSMDREVPFPSLEKITDAINDGANGYETELSTLRQLCDELALRLSETDSLLQTYAPHSSTQFKFNGEALTKYNSTKGSEG